MENEKPSFGVNLCVCAQASAHKNSNPRQANKQANKHTNERTIFFRDHVECFFAFISTSPQFPLSAWLTKMCTHKNISIRKVSLSENLNTNSYAQ